MDVLESSGNFIFHEEYEGVKNDIALIRLTSSIPSHSYVNIVDLPCRSDDWISLVGKSATISGFGRVNDVYMQPSERLRYITQQIYDNSICEKSYGKANVKETNLCLSGANGRSTCNGDSGRDNFFATVLRYLKKKWIITIGGPLTMEIDPGRRVIVGIVSFGAQIGCTLGHPVVFTRVTSYLHWIETKTGIHINDYC
jgi:secreted trypsin-like serine protease